MRIGIIAALPGELKPLVRGWKKQPLGGKGLTLWKTSRNKNDLVAVCGGMGAQAAIRSVAAAESFGKLDLLISVGWAGALDKSIKTRQCYRPSRVIDVGTGERFSAAEGDPITLATATHVADANEKGRLRQSYGAALVDMEAATIARLALIREVPFFCFKAVSDASEAELPDLNEFIDPRGQMRMPSFLSHVALHPKFWGPLWELGRNSTLAAQAMAKEINQFLAAKHVQ
ncbi:phosphorylase family protein [Edaphobacter albus]|uniref:phosphorylase family protein n=1 Tax=Edaphobacter sp. 4G125 TaxID=2763071 RepID=UPI0016476AC4|nr:nucleoside phosphorylase [Edaphobacter sp. 4G125]QNI35481.1 nucleoside phosphorylase [Edaphobacter sp. 4G125]